MSNTKALALVFLLTAGAAGCRTAPCGGCAGWETCDAASDECVLNIGTRFDLVADDGNVPGDNWDPFFGPPDPYICVSTPTMEKCSSVKSDDATPSWNETLLTDLDGSDLLQTPLSFDYEDSDVDANDVICQGTLTLTPQWLHEGGFRFNCSNGSYASFTLRNTDRGTPAL